MFRFSDLDEVFLLNEVDMQLYSHQDHPRFVDLPCGFLICSDGQKVFIDEKARSSNEALRHAALTYDIYEDYLDDLRRKGIDIPPVERSVCKAYMEERGITEYKVAM